MPLPTREDLWWERLGRRLERPDARCREILDDSLVVRSDQPRFMRRSEDGTYEWPANPAYGDHAAARASYNNLFDELGEHLRIGPRPGPPIEF